MNFSFKDAFVTLASADIEKMTNFYTQLLGIEPNPYIPKVYAEFRLPNLRLGIFKSKENQFLEFQNTTESAMSLCLEVSNLEDAIAHFTNLGYPPSGQIIVASHGREIYAYDPDGNRVILHESNQ
mgnify:CR=1 FL=1